MSSAQENRYRPDYAVHPGELLDECLDSHGMAQKELAARTGITPKTINEIVQGKAPLTPETALKLERVFGRPAQFWNNLEREYQEVVARKAERDQLQSAINWLKRVPVKELVKFGWIKKQSSNIDQLEEMLRFFGVASPDQWKAVWENYQVVYRQTKRFETCAEAVSAWLRQGEIEGQAISCAPFNKARFLEVLREARSLTTEQPKVFQPRLVELCASAGVAVVFVPELPRTGLWGSTRWLTTDIALIQLSLRYKTNDHLWFTFFHEAGHVLLHGKKDVFLEGKGMDDGKEAEANRFSADFLIPQAEHTKFLKQRPSLSRIREFADHLGIAPGIVVGRLQHDKEIGPDIGNQLKSRYQWVWAKKERESECQ